MRYQAHTRPILLIFQTYNILEFQYFSTIDLKNRYCEIPFREASKSTAEFTVPERRLFQFKVLLFVLHLTSATFQRMMSEIVTQKVEGKASGT